MRLVINDTIEIQIVAGVLDQNAVREAVEEIRSMPRVRFPGEQASEAQKSTETGFPSTGGSGSCSSSRSGLPGQKNEEHPSREGRSL